MTPTCYGGQVAELVPSQILWINVPAISWLHWHPVSISQTQAENPRDANSPGTVIVCFKAYGAWTKVNLNSLDIAWNVMFVDVC